METQHANIADELAALAQREWGNAIKAVIHKALDTRRCPECDGSGIAIEWNLETMTRREVWCECKAPVIGRFVCSWCRGILEECETVGQSDGICPSCRAMFTAMGKETNEQA